MANWLVEGADRATGKEIVTTIEALTAEGAERAATAEGVLVSSVTPSDVGDSHGPNVSPVSALNRRQLDVLERIARDTASIRGWATLAGVVLVLMLIAGIVSAVLRVLTGH